MASLLLLDYLQRCRAQYSLLKVEPGYTADECVRLNHIPPQRLAKAVMIKLDDELAMVVMPSHHQLVMERLAQELGVKGAQLAAERQFRNRFPRCELGAVPPIGHIFGIRAFIAPGFDESAEVYCKPGAHGELLYMPFHELKRFAHWDPIGPVARAQLKSPSVGHLQRLVGLAKSGTRLGARAPLQAAIPASL